jgi:hypothetical protein
MVLLSATIYLGSIPQQSDFFKIILSGAFAFLGYGYLTFFTEMKQGPILALGIIMRVGFLFFTPNLSDDIYRFVWDGQLTAHGMNPYGYLPSAIISEMDGSYWHELFINMNSPDYYTIYPPITQLIFYISTWAGENIFWSGFIIKLCFLVAEFMTFIGLVKLLRAMKKPTSLASIYFLNPLIIVEGMGNLHFEIVMISFLVWGIYYTIVKDKMVLGALLFALSIASKLLPLMFLPYFLLKLSGKKRVLFFIAGLLFIVICFLPIILGLDFANFGSSIDLYFQKFEFNASIYYISRFFGRLWSGYNLIRYIGPLLGIISIILILKKAFTTEKYSLESFFEFAFFSFCTYLFLATTVHPWYLAIPVMLSVFVRFRFAVAWSFLILLSYINYSYDPYFENLWVVSLEYLFLFGIIVYEIKFPKLLALSPPK